MFKNISCIISIFNYILSETHISSLYIHAKTVNCIVEHRYKIMSCYDSDDAHVYGNIIFFL